LFSELPRRVLLGKPAVPKVATHRILTHAGE
jgi:hypothetical protein